MKVTKTQRQSGVLVRITASYQTCCFCDKKQYPAGPPVQYYPRFQFRKAAKEYASVHGLTIVSWGHNGDKSALAETNEACVHFPNNRVRLDWNIDRTIYDD